MIEDLSNDYRRELLVQSLNVDYKDDAVYKAVTEHLPKLIMRVANDLIVTYINSKVKKGKQIRTFYKFDDDPPPYKEISIGGKIVRITNT